MLKISVRGTKQISLSSAIFTALCIFLFVLPAAKAEGFIQIDTEKGVTVFLNGKFDGSVENTPYIIQGVAAGSHEVKLVKPGFESKTVKVNVRDGDIEVIKHRSFRPAARVTQEGEQSQESSQAKTGSLRIRTVPIECKVTIEGLDLAKEDQIKKQSDWILNPVMVNTYRVSLEPISSGKKVSFNAQVFEGEESRYLINLLNGEIVDQRAEERAQLLAQQAIDAAAAAAQQEAEAERLEAERIERRFKDDYSNYLKARENPNLSHIQKAMMWKNLCKTWGVDPGAGVRLVWTNGRVTVTR